MRGLVAFLVLLLEYLKTSNPEKKEQLMLTVKVSSPIACCYCRTPLLHILVCCCFDKHKIWRTRVCVCLIYSRGEKSSGCGSCDARGLSCSLWWCARLSGSSVLCRSGGGCGWRPASRVGCRSSASSCPSVPPTPLPKAPQPLPTRKWNETQHTTTPPHHHTTTTKD